MRDRVADVEVEIVGAVAADALAEHLRAQIAWPSCSSARMPLPGHSVPLVASVVPEADAVLQIVLPPRPVRKLFASMFAIFCGRTLRLWLTEPNDCAGR